MRKARKRPLTSVEIFGLVDEFVRMLAEEINVPAERIYAFVKKALWTETAKREERLVLEEQVIALRCKGLNNTEIAKALKVSKAKIYYFVSQLIRENRIERRLPGRPRGRKPIDLSSACNQTIV